MAMIDPYDDDFGAICNCAVRYAVGRRTYDSGNQQDLSRSERKGYVSLWSGGLGRECR